MQTTLCTYLFSRNVFARFHCLYITNILCWWYFGRYAIIIYYDIWATTDHSRSGNRVFCDRTLQMLDVWRWQMHWASAHPPCRSYVTDNDVFRVAIKYSLYKLVQSNIHNSLSLLIRKSKSTAVKNQQGYFELPIQTLCLIQNKYSFFVSQISSLISPIINITQRVIKILWIVIHLFNTLAVQIKKKTWLDR